MKRTVAVVFVLAVTVLFSWSVQAAGDAAKGKVLAKGCTCHKGDLDGMNADKFTEMMLGFKDGSLEQRIMNNVAKKYSEQDITDMAAWFAKQ